MMLFVFHLHVFQDHTLNTEVTQQMSQNLYIIDPGLLLDSKLRHVKYPVACSRTMLNDAGVH